MHVGSIILELSLQVGTTETVVSNLGRNYGMQLLRMCWEEIGWN